MISRRELLLQAAPAFAVLGPLRVAAQQEGKIYRIGLLMTPPSQPDSAFRALFIAALRDLGYVEGRNLVIEVRSADNRPERLPALATELAQLNVDVIVTKGDGEVRAAKRATRTIPIVMDPSGDPVAAGYIASLARPGGNVTGLTIDAGPEMASKMLQLLKESAPKESRVAVILGVKPRLDVPSLDGSTRTTSQRHRGGGTRIGSDTAFSASAKRDRARGGLHCHHPRSC